MSFRSPKNCAVAHDQRGETSILCKIFNIITQDSWCVRLVRQGVGEGRYLIVTITHHAVGSPELVLRSNFWDVSTIPAKRILDYRNWALLIKINVSNIVLEKGFVNCVLPTLELDRLAYRQNPPLVREPQLMPKRLAPASRSRFLKQ